MFRVLVGLSVAIFSGIVLGLLASSLPTSIKHSWIFKLICEAPKNIAPIAWIPFVILAFGIGNLPSLVIVFIGAFPLIFTSTYRGAESVPSITRNISASMEIGYWKKLTCVTFMSALPDVFTGIQNGKNCAWWTIIAAEMISGQSGLGYSNNMNRLNMQYCFVVLDIAWIAIGGFMLSIAFDFIQRKVIRWKDA